jgi:SSS family solute:Na+ symporter
VGALVIPILGLIECGGWDGSKSRVLANTGKAGYFHLWTTLSSFHENPMGNHWTGIVFGLGFVGGLGYWTTDFLVVQRLFAAKDLRAAQMGPVIGAFFNLAVPLIVILPGLIGAAVLPSSGLPCLWFQKARRLPVSTPITKCCLYC